LEAVATPGNKGCGSVRSLSAMKKGPYQLCERSTTATIAHNPGTHAMLEIELLTETSTQIRVSEPRKLPYLNTLKGEQQMITGTLFFSKIFLCNTFRAVPI
jgi:hypothetical protein